MSAAKNPASVNLRFDTTANGKFIVEGEIFFVIRESDILAIA